LVLFLWRTEEAYKEMDSASVGESMDVSFFWSVSLRLLGCFRGCYSLNRNSRRWLHFENVCVKYWWSDTSISVYL